MKLNSLVSSATLVGLMTFMVPALQLVQVPTARAESLPSTFIAQNNPFNEVDDGFHSLIIDTIRMVESAKKAMKSNDPEIKAMGQKMYESSMRDLQSMMSMYMKKFPVRTTSPHGI